MVGRAAQGNPWVAGRDHGRRRPPLDHAARRSRASSSSSSARRCASSASTAPPGFLKKFYGWYLGRGRFPKPFKQELVQLADDRRASSSGCLLPSPARSTWPSGSARNPTASTSCFCACRSRPTAAADEVLLADTHAGAAGAVRGGGASRPARTIRLHGGGCSASAGSSPCSSRTSSARRRSASSSVPSARRCCIDEVMRLMSAEVERLEGTVVQYIGDELYAVFGAPLSHEDDSERAVRAGARHPACARPLRGRRSRRPTPSISRSGSPSTRGPSSSGPRARIRTTRSATP